MDCELLRNDIPDKGVENMDVQRSVMARWKNMVSVILLLAVFLMYVTEKGDLCFINVVTLGKLLFTPIIL